MFQEPYHTNYVPLKNYPDKNGKVSNKGTNYGFWWLWEAENDAANKPVLVTFAGGPGTSVMSKAFGTYNPIDVDPTNKRFVRNPNALTSHFNLLYIESPVGAGFSTIAKGNPVKKYNHVAQNAEEIIEDVLRVHGLQNLRNQNWYYNGEAFCGLQVPKIANHLRRRGYPYGGTMLFTPIVHRDQMEDYDEHIDFLHDKKMFGNCCQECCCKCCLCCGSCCFKCGCIDFTDYEGCWYTPWCCFEEKKDKGKKGKQWKAAPTNVAWKHCNENEGMKCRNEIVDVITSQAFHKTVNAKKVVDKLENAKDTPITSYDKSYSSNSDINELIATGRPFLVVTGEGDYTAPWKLLKKNAEKKWDVYKNNDMKKQNWYSDNQKVEHKSHGNFTWERWHGVGHLPFVDDPVLYTDTVNRFLNGGQYSGGGYGGNQQYGHGSGLVGNQPYGGSGVHQSITVNQPAPQYQEVGGNPRPTAVYNSGHQVGQITSVPGNFGSGVQQYGQSGYQSNY